MRYSAAQSRASRRLLPRSRRNRRRCLILGCWMLDALTRPQVLPFLNLSGSASLRETSAIQSREELFTPRRQGANEEAFQSKSTIPFLNLSGFASLREPENCVERGLCRNAGEGAAGPSKSVLICGAARHFRFCLLSSYL